MIHYRQAIREELRARAAGLPGMTSSPVDFVASSIQESNIPTAVVTFQSEEIEGVMITDDGEATTRVLRVSIRMIARRPDDLEKMAFALETRMLPPIAGGVLHHMTGSRFEEPGRGESDYFSIALDYEIRFTLLSSDPSRVAP